MSKNDSGSDAKLLMSIAAIATHGLFTEDALTQIRDCGLLTEIVCTNSHPRAQELADDFLRVESVAGLFVGALKGAS